MTCHNSEFRRVMAWWMEIIERCSPVRLLGCGSAMAIGRSIEAQLTNVDPFQGDTQDDRGGLWYQVGTQLSCVQTETFEQLANPLSPLVETFE